MKTANLGEYFMWRGQITRVESINPGHKAIGFKTQVETVCPHCKEKFMQDEWHDVIESSPNFQDGATPIETIKER